MYKQYEPVYRSNNGVITEIVVRINSSLIKQSIYIGCFFVLLMLALKKKTLLFLMEKLKNYYHKKVMLFINEYDTPFIEVHINDLYQDISNGLTVILHNSLKSSSYL